MRTDHKLLGQVTPPTDFIPETSIKLNSAAPFLHRPLPSRSDFRQPSDCFEGRRLPADDAEIAHEARSRIDELPFRDAPARGGLDEDVVVLPVDCEQRTDGVRVAEEGDEEIGRGVGALSVGVDVNDRRAEEVLGVDAGDWGPERGFDVGEAGEVGVGAGVVGRGSRGEGLVVAC